ncbi:MAG: hypothetical protein ACYCYE_11915 [Clostridia bacterium]
MVEYIYYIMPWAKIIEGCDAVGLWGRDVARTRYVGQVYVDQLSSIKKEKGVLERIAPRCENCNSNEYYGIYETSRLFRFLNIPLVQCDTVYYLSCPECNFGFKLEPEEFKTLEQVALINTKYLEGLITKTEFENSLRSIQE